MLFQVKEIMLKARV